jgi:hypothetical protein
MADDSGIIDGHSMRISNTMHTFDFQEFNESDYFLNDISTISKQNGVGSWLSETPSSSVCGQCHSLEAVAHLVIHK